MEYLHSFLSDSCGFFFFIGTNNKNAVNSIEKIFPAGDYDPQNLEDETHKIYFDFNIKVF